MDENLTPFRNFLHFSQLAAKNKPDEKKERNRRINRKPEVEKET